MQPRVPPRHHTGALARSATLQNQTFVQSRASRLLMRFDARKHSLRQRLKQAIERTMLKDQHASLRKSDGRRFAWLNAGQANQIAVSPQPAPCPAPKHPQPCATKGEHWRSNFSLSQNVYNHNNIAFNTHLKASVFLVLNTSRWTGQMTILILATMVPTWDEYSNTSRGRRERSKL
jgi:hypothetical protein